MRLLRQIGHDTQYVLLGFPLSLVALPLLVTGFGVGVGTAVLWVGLPILVGTLWLARGLATLERFRVAPTLGARLPHPDYRRPRPSHGGLRRLLTPVADVQSWLDLLHGVFRLVPATVAFAFVITWWAGALGGLTWPLWAWSLPDGPNDSNLPELLGLSGSYTSNTIFHMALGFFFLGTLYFIVRAAALLEARFAQALLSGVAELRRQIRTEVDQRRAVAVETETAALTHLVGPGSSLGAGAGR